MPADLHIHSVYSDGIYTPEEICRRAKARGLSLLSITDHDTLAGEEEKRAAAQKYGLTYVTGWEISAYLHGEKTHILGYGCQRGEEYERFMQARKRAAFLRAEESVQKLRGLGISLTLEEVLAERAQEDLPVHSMHVARALGKKIGLEEGVAYYRYLAVGRVAHSNIGRPTPKEAIDCIHALGGVASIAHPGRMLLGFAAREKMLKEVIAMGADGIESVYTTHTEEETAYFSALARAHGLLVTGGSDTHYEADEREGDLHRIGSPDFTPSRRLLERIS